METERPAGTAGSDDEARRRAVDPARSVIVQAPAGSGKTTLLVERFLALLGTVEAPEEILAITFTRKAAAEMRQRILKFLDPEFEPENHERAAHDQARAAEARVRAWALRENPQRLQIRTIDSFNHFLARSMPVASQLGPPPAPTENARPLYRDAARRVLELLDGDEDLATDVARLLVWRDHNGRDIEELLAGLLARREQWLRVLGTDAAPRRAHLERLVEALVRDLLAETRSRLAAALAAAGYSGPALAELLGFAHASLLATDQASGLSDWAGATDLPQPEPSALSAWRGLADLLLTQKGTWRKGVTVSQGFPPSAEEKAPMAALLTRLGGDHALAELLDAARHAPDPHYDESDWAVLESLVRVLRRAAAELDVLFAERGQCDFAGIGQASLRALGDPDAGITDLGLYLDRRIGHILVDEFQDTNHPQFHLLERLTAGWSPGDGHSLFLVGDPMQSIYRFREAEVGLFIRAREHGVGGLPLESLRLLSNFRSRAELVEWVNGRIGPVFPADEDIAEGAVGYAPSRAGRDPGGRTEVLAHTDRAAEARALAALLKAEQQARRDEPDFRSAILVRGRNHLAEILPALKLAGVRYRAVGLDPLAARPVVQDLLALTRAILNPADRSAVLAVLRSPPVGLRLAELLVLAEDRKTDPLDPARIGQLAPEARARAEAVRETLEAARALWRRRPVAELVEGAWTRLGGPNCIADPSPDRSGDLAADFDDAADYLAFLAVAEAEGALEDLAEFSDRLGERYSETDPHPDGGPAPVEILTIHRAKGLEWDLVILPALERSIGGRDRELLHWLPFVTEAGTEEVLLAPLRSARQAENSRLVNFIRDRRQARDALENQRLLYVATTRARERLVLSACPVSAKGEIKAPKGSLLADLWPTLEDDFSAALPTLPAAGDEGTDHPGQTERALPDQALRRVADGWRPTVPPGLDWKPALPAREREVEIEFNWAGLQARRTGTVLHRLLERVGQLGIENLDGDRRRRLIERIPALLRSLGSGEDGLRDSAAIIREAFEDTLDSETGQWVLSGRHRDAACELAIGGVLDGKLINAVIDRTFIDSEGVRWIIDYKSGHHAGGDLEGFLAEEAERYDIQLQVYRRLFEQMGETAIRTALYLPRHGRLQEVGAGG